MPAQSSTHSTFPRFAVLVLLAAALLTALWFLRGNGAEPTLARNVVPAVEADPDPPRHEPTLGADVPAREPRRPTADAGGPPRESTAGSVVVRVVDPDGAPVAGFPLQLWRDGPFPDEGSELQGTEVAETDSNGESRVDARALPRDVEIAPAALFVRTPGVAISRDSSSPLVLRVPHTASVLVRLVDEDGVLWTTGGRAWLGPYPRTPGRKQLEEGVARFPHVALHQPYDLRIDSLGEYATIENRFPGLRADERERVHEVVVTHRLPVLTARLLLEDGGPYAGAQGTGKLQYDADGQYRLLILNADEEGRVRIPVGLPHLAGRSRALTLSIVGPSGHRDHEASFDLSYPLTPEDHDLGDVVLSRRSTVVAGWIEEPGGERLAFRNLVLVRRTPTASEPEVLDHFMSNKEGRFLLMDEAPAGDLAIDLPDPTGWHDRVFVLPAPVPFEAGDEDVVLRVVDAARVRGSVGGVEALERIDLVLRLTYRDGAVVDVPVRRDGQFFQKGLDPGTVDATVMVEEGGPALAQHSGLELRPGEEVLLDTLRLDAALRRIRVTVTGPDRREGLQVRFREGGDGSYEHEPDESRGVYSILSAADRVDVLVTAPLYRPQEFQAVVGDIECRMVPALRLEVRAELPVDSLPSGVRIFGGLLHASSQAPDWERGILIAEDRDSTLLTGFAPGPGVYEVTLILQRDSPEAHAQVPTTGTLEVLEDAETPSFRVSVDPASVEKALSTLEQK